MIFITKTAVRNALCAALVFGLWAASAEAKGPDYQLGAGDVIDIKVFGETEFSGIFRINSEGMIDYPFLRRIAAAGRTTDQLSKELTGRLKDGYLSDPQVSVDVRDYKSRTVLVLGAVGRPGSYSLDEDAKVLSLISRAGGITPTGGKRILLTRGSGEQKPSEKSVAEVSKAGVEKPSTDAAKILDDKAATILSSGSVKPIVIDYFRLTHEGDVSQNIELQDGDILNVPKANEIFVLGNVGRPGPVAFEDNMTILQAVTLAGGPTAMASTKSTYILRQGPNGEEKIGVRFDKIMDNKAKNFLIKADDVIVIPESFF